MNKSKRPVVVVTGASAGVGRATARAFGARGYAVALLARGIDGLEAAREEIQQSGSEALALPTDVADAEQVEAAAAAAEHTLGPIDVWVNNATVSVFSPVMQMTADEFRRVTEVTYLGYVHGTLAALRRMMPRNAGTIVQVGSALAYRAIPLQSAYCAAKHAIAGFTESLRTELLHDGSAVHLTIVQLPAINTPQFDWNRSRMPRMPQPVPPIFQPEVAAEAIVWSATHRRRELYVGWPTVKAIVGDKMAPGLLDRYLANQGYDAQQTDVPAAQDRPDNLWHPLPGDHGAHGRFDARSRSFSWQLWVTTHKWQLLGGIAAALGWRVAQRRTPEGKHVNRAARRPIAATP